MGQSILELNQKMKQEIIIASDDSKSKCKSGGPCIIADLSFDQLSQSTRINWRPLLFINEYCRYFMIMLNSQVNYFCDNLEIVNKILNLIENPNHYDEYIYAADHDAV